MLLMAATYTVTAFIVLAENLFEIMNQKNF
jgi:hypothetical protein